MLNWNCILNIRHCQFTHFANAGNLNHLTSYVLWPVVLETIYACLSFRLSIQNAVLTLEWLPYGWGNYLKGVAAETRCEIGQLGNYLKKTEFQGLTVLSTLLVLIFLSKHHPSPNTVIQIQRFSYTAQKWEIQKILQIQRFNNNMILADKEKQQYA